MRPDVVELDRISDYPDYWAARRPGHEAMVLHDLRLTYADLAAAVDRCARAMFAAGVRRGDRVAVLCTPRPEGLICFLAAARLGAMFSGLNLRFKRDELAYVVGDSAPRLLIGLPRFEERDYRDDLRALAEGHPSIERVVTFFEAVPGLSQAYDEFLGGGAAVDADAYARALGEVGPDDPVLLIYTSGSSGRPKGAMLSHRGLSHCHRNQCDHWWAEPLRILDNLTLSNVFGVGDLFCCCLVGGGTTVFMERFDARGVLATIEREKVTVWGQVATMLQLALAHPDFATFELSSLQLIFWAGAPAPRDLILKLQAICPNLSTNYGLTETVSGVTYAKAGSSLEVLAETAGAPDPHYELRIVAPDGRVLGDGEEGEIQVRGLCQMVGYYNRPEATAQMIDGEGWLHSGDIGIRRPDGNYRIVGRLSDMYKSGGFNVYPREIEILLESHPDIAMAAVVGVRDGLYGEVGWAYLMPESGAVLNEAELTAWCRARLANFKVPKRFIVRDQLPMLAVGKVDKAALKRAAAEGRAA
ncbi:MAG TPA: class I adenylate-forming enzyme family protein [Methylomirabilota bacterium]|nr:class I adenylate-forming enzyme family protein [Methylomirabilota bacterium]